MTIYILCGFIGSAIVARFIAGAKVTPQLRKSGLKHEALAVDEELARHGSSPIGGDPAELIARQAACALLKELNQPSELQRAARSLDADLQQGRWRLAPKS